MHNRDVTIYLKFDVIAGRNKNYVKGQFGS